MNFLAWDIEIAKELPQDVEDWKAHRPLGISCAAARDSSLDVEGPAGVWYTGYKTGIPQPKAMSSEEARQMVLYLWKMQEIEGVPIVTWNGLQFDFDVLAEESGEFGMCKSLAMDHIDIMFQFFCYKGYFLGLDKAAKHQGIEGKPEGMSGALAPSMWAGTVEERWKVLEYVVDDTRITLELAQKVQEQGYIKWVSNSGRSWRCEFPDGLLTVRECINRIPEPDTSWMDNPTSREKMLAWTKPKEKATV